MIIPVGKTFMILPQPTHSVTSVATSEGVPIIIRLILFLTMLACFLGEVNMVKSTLEWDRNYLVVGCIVLLMIVTALMGILVWS